MAKVMIVDDDRDFMDSICRVLQHRGHQTTAIYDTEEVIEKLEREPHEVLVLDVMFPENAAAGFHLAQEIRKHKTLTKLPILILSAINTKFPMGFGPGDIDETWMPVQDFLEKPIDFDVLGAKVEKLAGQEAGGQ
jgi:DNA-binding response OmpR family regulator